MVNVVGMHWADGRHPRSWLSGVRLSSRGDVNYSKRAEPHTAHGHSTQQASLLGTAVTQNCPGVPATRLLESRWPKLPGE